MPLSEFFQNFGLTWEEKALLHCSEKITLARLFPPQVG